MLSLRTSAISASFVVKPKMNKIVAYTPRQRISANLPHQKLNNGINITKELTYFLAEYFLSL